MVNVYLPEQRSLCFAKCLCVGAENCSTRGSVAVLRGADAPVTCAQLGPAIQPAARRDLQGPAPSGCFPAFANVCVWFPVRIHIIISNKDTFTLVRIITYQVLSLVIPLSISCTPQNLHNNQTSKPEPFSGRKDFPLYYFNKINYNDQFNLNLLFRYFFCKSIEMRLKSKL